MKRIAYKIARLWVKICMHAYFGKIKVSGIENVPKDKPVLFLSNHQNALLDVLLIGIDCNRESWFLARSDVFMNKTLKALFDVFQMIPIYRIRDGRDSLKNNQEVFDRCSKLLIKGEAILMFPEGNHNLKRRVRPLSKGFTRILFNTLQQAPNTDIFIVPVGVNYQEAVRFPDKAAVCFGESIAVKGLYDVSDEKKSIEAIKSAVSDKMKTLTTHIEDLSSYDDNLAKLDAAGVDYLNPQEVNIKLKDIDNLESKGIENSFAFIRQILKNLFVLINFPMVLLWRKLVKPIAKEPEFRGTLRYALVLVGYPIYFVLLFIILGFAFSFSISLVTIIGLVVISWLLVRVI